MESSFRIGICLGFLVGGAAAALAEDGFIDQRVRASFPPFSAFLFSSSNVGSVQSSSAVVFSREGAIGEYIVGAQFARFKEPSSLLTFFLRGKDASFAATPVRKLTSDEVQLTPKEEFDAEALQADQQRQQIERESLSYGTQLQDLRSRAMRIAGVDELIQLQTELNRYQTAEDQRQSEEVRLQELLRVGRQVADPADVDPLRQKLSESLRDTAQVTAHADRLKNRKKEAAKEEFQEKLALIKEMGRYSREELAREILMLRAKRKQLEARLPAEE